MKRLRPIITVIFCVFISITSSLSFANFAYYFYDAVGKTEVLNWRLCNSGLVADVISNIGTIDIVLGECDR